MNITINGPPIPLARHRSFRMGKTMCQYDPQAEIKSDIAQYCLQFIERKITGAISANMEFHLDRPKSHYRTGKKNQENIKFIQKEINLLESMDNKTFSDTVQLKSLKNHLQYDLLLRESAPLYPTGRPDIDNYIKFYLDVLNGIAYKDDSQIVKIKAVKMYSSPAKTVIELTEIS